MNRHAFTLVELLIVLTIIGILAGLAIPVVGMAQEAQRRTKSQTTLTQLMAAIENFKTTNGTYPRTAPSDSSQQVNEMVPMGDMAPEAANAPGTGDINANAGSAPLDKLATNSRILERILKAYAPGNVPNLVDAWKNRIFYLDFRSYTTTPDEQPNLDSFQLWSRGSNGRNDSYTWKIDNNNNNQPLVMPWGGKDDLTNWK